MLIKLLITVISINNIIFKQKFGKIESIKTQKNQQKKVNHLKLIILNLMYILLIVVRYALEIIF